MELHLGKMAWSGDTGQDYDKNIAQERFYHILEEMRIYTILMLIRFLFVVFLLVVILLDW